MAALETNCLLSCMQFGRTTCGAVVTLIQHTLNGVEGERCGNSKYLSLSKAFDMILHDILLFKPSNLGFNVNTGGLTKSYLTNRS